MGLEIRDHTAFQRREWVAERVGWVLLAGLVLAGLLGLLGTGPFSWTTTSAGPLVVEYDRITHHEADENITLRFGPDVVEDGTISAEVTGAWVSGVDVQSVTPEPTEQRMVPGGVVMEFTVDRPGQLAVAMTFRAQQYGTLDAVVAADGEEATFSQLVLP